MGNLKKIKYEKNKFTFFIAITFFIASCNSGADKIGLNNVEMHRAYQDSLILKSKLPEEKLNTIKLLITEYKKMGNDESINNSNYNYYLARLYSYIYSIPLYGNFYDTLNNKLLNNDKDNNKDNKYLGIIHCGIFDNNLYY